MKWWYVLFIILGVGFGGWLWGKYGIKTATRVDVVDENDIQSEISKPTKTLIKTITKNSIVDGDGKKIDVDQVMGQVTSWNPDSGVLEFSREGKTWKITIDLSKTTMMVNSIKVPSKFLSVISKNDPNWDTGFCLGDEIVLMSKGKEVMFVENNGYRTCGNRDK